MRKNGEACCYFLGYKISLRKAFKNKNFEKTMNGKSCVSCKEDGPHMCLLPGNCAALFVL